MWGSVKTQIPSFLYQLVNWSGKLFSANRTSTTTLSRKLKEMRRLETPIPGSL